MRNPVSVDPILISTSSASLSNSSGSLIKTNSISKNIEKTDNESYNSFSVLNNSIKFNQNSSKKRKNILKNQIILNSVGRISNKNSTTNIESVYDFKDLNNSVS